MSSIWEITLYLGVTLLTFLVVYFFFFRVSSKKKRKEIRVSPDVSQEVCDAAERALKDERPAFQHGRNLIKMTKEENLKMTLGAQARFLWEYFFVGWFSSSSRSMEEEEISPPPPPPSFSPKDFILNEKSRGWLHFLYRKSVIVKDDWSIDGSPHPWWDKYSHPPMLSFPRFDCSESSYFLALVADKLPAWREVFVTILDGLCERHVSFWGGVDFLTQFGHDLENENYPPNVKKMLLPPKAVLGGDYDQPGWTGHGVANPANNLPSRLASDPISVKGMLFFKGFLSILMGIRQRVGGDSRWKEKWEMSGRDDEKVLWTYDELCSTLSSQFNGNSGKGLN
mmetsp:Transcript_13539/g.18565  ORF Transcript_13539/g.18565 Transcript_13539/m.18565 type:complete len:339 (+) Transcript_13539:86-1102(+)